MTLDRTSRASGGQAGRLVMVSGATGGIGRAICQALLGEGARLSIGVRDPARIADDPVLAPSDRVLVSRYDATRPETTRQWVERSCDEGGRIDAVVASAGVLLPHGFDSPDDAALDRMWQINVKAVLELVRATLPIMIGQGGGRVVTVASMSGLRPGRTGLGYAMTKAALIAMTHHLRTMHWEDGIRATAICPGAVETPMTEGLRGPSGPRFTPPEEIAASVAYLLSLGRDASVAVLAVNNKPESLW